ncbi:MAG: dienelactone hydrolase family protein [Polyangia bacterium]
MCDHDGWSCIYSDIGQGDAMWISRAILVAGPLMWFTATASAAPPVAKRRTVDYTIGDQAFEGVFFYPESAKGKVPGVVMVHNWMGVTGETEKQAERVARLGLAVFAVDVYGKGVRPKDMREAAAVSGRYKSDRKLLRERLVRGLDVLRHQKEVDPAKVIAVGYCFGGTGVIELARAGADVAAVVSFHGGLDSPNPADGKNIKAKVVALQGADDPFVKPADIAAFQNEMRSNKVDWEMTIYGGAVHSFTDTSAGNDPTKGGAYNPTADKRSFEVLTDLVHDLFFSRK